MRFAVLASAVFMLFALSARADSMTDVIQLSAVADSGQTISLSYLLTMDVSKNTFTPTTKGIQLLSVSNSDPTFAAAFALPPTWVYYFAGADATLTIGSDTFTPGLSVPLGTDSYFFQIYGFGEYNPYQAPYFGTFSETSASGASYEFGHDIFGKNLYHLTCYSYSSTPVETPTSSPTCLAGPTTSNPSSAVTPEPSTFVLLATGLLGVARAVRRRHAV